MKRFIVFLYILCLSVPFLSAQTLMDKLKKTGAGEGSIIIYQDPEIEALLNGTEYPPKPAKPTVKPQPVVAHKGNKAKKVSENGGKEKGTSLSDNITTIPDNVSTDQYGRKIYKRSVTMNGYRIRLYSGNNSREARQKAYSTGYLFKSSYLDIPVYTHFVSPHWNCTVGNFRTYEEAQRFLNELRATNQFNGAIIIKSKIQVAQ